MVDSNLANKIIMALKDALEPEEFGQVMSMLKDAGMIDSMERQSIESAMNPEGMASDHRFPHQNRLLAGISYAADSISSHSRPPSAPRATATQLRERDEMFPNYNRLLNGGKSFDERFGTARIKQAV